MAPLVIATCRGMTYSVAMTTATRTADPADLRIGFGDRMRRVRLGLGLNQSQFAELLGLSDATIGKYEVQSKDPRNASQVASTVQIVFGVRRAWLITGNGPAMLPGRALGDFRDREPTGSGPDQIGIPDQRLEPSQSDLSHWGVTDRDPTSTPTAQPSSTHVDGDSGKRRPDSRIRELVSAIGAGFGDGLRPPSLPLAPGF
jgi:DNA-binding XRE family transcriptional regulator